MSYLPCVNPQIIDSVASGSLLVNGNASAHAMGALYQSLAQSAGLAAMNAVTMQQQSNMIHQAATTMGVNLIYSLGGASVGKSTKRLRA